MEDENEGNENKIILGDSNCTVDKMDRDGRNKTLYKCRFNYALSKLIVDNGEGIPSGTRSRIGRVYTDVKITSNTKINYYYLQVPLKN